VTNAYHTLKFSKEKGMGKHPRKSIQFMVNWEVNVTGDKKELRPRV
jgi:hypothetical protein